MLRHESIFHRVLPNDLNTDRTEPLSTWARYLKTFPQDSSRLQQHSRFFSCSNITYKSYFGQEEEK